MHMSLKQKPNPYPELHYFQYQWGFCQSEDYYEYLPSLDKSKRRAARENISAHVLCAIFQIRNNKKFWEENLRSDVNMPNSEGSGPDK